MYLLRPSGVIILDLMGPKQSLTKVFLYDIINTTKERKRGKNMPFGIPSEDFHGGFGLPHEDFEPIEEPKVDTRNKAKAQMDEILSYIAENFVSPLCFDNRPAKEVYLEHSGEKFNDLVAFCYNLIDKEE